MSFVCAGLGLALPHSVSAVGTELMFSKPGVCPGERFEVIIVVDNRLSPPADVVATFSGQTGFANVLGSCTAEIGSCSVVDAVTATYMGTLPADTTTTFRFASAFVPPAPGGVPETGLLCATVASTFNGAVGPLTRGCVAVNKCEGAPTASPWGLAILAVVLLGLGVLFVRRTNA